MNFATISSLYADYSSKIKSLPDLPFFYFIALFAHPICFSKSRTTLFIHTNSSTPEGLLSSMKPPGLLSEVHVSRKICENSAADRSPEANNKQNLAWRISQLMKIPALGRTKLLKDQNHFKTLTLFFIIFVIFLSIPIYIYI